jgi:hypothetical protein
VGDAARTGLVLAAVTWAVADGPRAAIAFVLVAPAAFGVRLLPAGERLDGVLCSMLLTAQLGAAAGLTESAGWWDAAAHAATAALLIAVLSAVLPANSPRTRRCERAPPKPRVGGRRMGQRCSFPDAIRAQRLGHSE